MRCTSHVAVLHKCQVAWVSSQKMCFQSWFEGETSLAYCAHVSFETGMSGYMIKVVRAIRVALPTDFALVIQWYRCSFLLMWFTCRFKLLLRASLHGQCGHSNRPCAGFVVTRYPKCSCDRWEMFWTATEARRVMYFAFRR